MKVIEKYIPDSNKIYKAKEPFEATVIENIKLTLANSEDDIRHLVIDLSQSGISFLEGQSIGVVKPMEGEGRKYSKVRLYSIASARSGDDGLASTVSLCVKRVVYEDKEDGKIKYGMISNYICDRQKGDKIYITGPIGRRFLLPDDENVNLIMIAVGTGIAPFRAFINFIYNERGSWKGNVRLFFGAKTGMESIYMNDENNDLGLYYTQETYKAYKALSRESTIDDGNAYVQDRIEEQRKEIWSVIKDGNFCLYICGLSAVLDGVENIFQKWAKEDGFVWDEMRKQFKKEGRWNVEVY